MATPAGAKLTTEERIQKLLQKAETTTPAEAEALTAKAEELMLKYGIDRAIINSRSTGEKERIERLHIPLKGIYAMAYESMMSSIVWAYGGGEIKSYYTQWKQSDVTLTIVGFENDVAQLKVLLASLQLQAVVALETWWKSPQRSDDGITFLTNAPNTLVKKPMEKFKARRQFIKSFGFGASERIRKARHTAVKEAEATTPGAEVVLRDRAVAVEEFLTANVPGLKTVKNREKPGGFGAGQAGYRAGQNANTGDRQVGAGRRAIEA